MIFSLFGHHMAAALEPQPTEGMIGSHRRATSLHETSEETVSQENLCTLVNDFTFKLDQIAEVLEVTGAGSGNASAAFAIWRSAREKVGPTRRTNRCGLYI
jgi:hypothetical protein